MPLALLCLVALWAASLPAREFRELPSALVAVEVRGVGVDPETLSPAVLLAEAGAAGYFPSTWVGPKPRRSNALGRKRGQSDR